jgi:hypothetical protein
MALTEQEEFELLSLEREKAMGSGQPKQPQQQAQQPNVLQQLLQGTQNAVGSLVGGFMNPPTQVIGRAGQAIESMLSGQPPQPYTLQRPQILGGDLEISPAKSLGQAMVPAAETSLMMAGPQIASGAGKLIGKISKFDNVLVQSKKAKAALDTLRDALGGAKQVALQEVKDIPVEFDLKKIPEKVLAKLRDPSNGYGIEFTAEGKIPTTLGNMDKIKMALQDMPSTKDFVEAGNMAKRQVINLSSELRDAIVSAANKAGKPELGKALSDYHNFMNNYEVVNSKLTDKFGNAMGNKLKESFRLTAEPAVKEAWSEIGKQSPEIKSIIRSRKNRELLKALLVTAPTIESGKRIITGRW